MAVWIVLQGDTKNLFDCGSCAVKFYNQDRTFRSQPRLIDPIDDMNIIRTCEGER